MKSIIGWSFNHQVKWSSMLIECWGRLISHVPLYLQVKYNGDRSAKRKLNKAYSLLISVCRDAVQYLLGPFLIYISLLIIFLSLFMQASAAISIVFEIFRTVIYLFVTLNVLLLLVGVFVFVFREIKHAITNLSSSGGTQNQNTHSTSRSSTRRSTSTSSGSTTGGSSKLKGHSRSSSSKMNDIELSGVSLPRGDYHDIELDEYGQIK